MQKSRHYYKDLMLFPSSLGAEIAVCWLFSISVKDYDYHDTTSTYFWIFKES